MVHSSSLAKIHLIFPLITGIIYYSEWAFKQLLATYVPNVCVTNQLAVNDLLLTSMSVFYSVT